MFIHSKYHDKEIGLLGISCLICGTMNTKFSIDKWIISSYTHIPLIPVSHMCVALNQLIVNTNTPISIEPNLDHMAQYFNLPGSLINN